MKKVAVVQWTTLRSRSNDRVGRRDLDTIRQHAADFIAKREAPAYIAKLVRFYDPSGNLIEVRTPINYN